MIKQDEIWKDIPGYEGLYQASTKGRIRSLDVETNCIVFGKKNAKRVRKGRIIKPFVNKGGYHIVGLYLDGKVKKRSVHSLVMLTFIGPPPADKPQINHKDENKLNNSLSNLEFCDASYNQNYGTCIQRRVEKQSKLICQCDNDGNIIKVYKSLSELGRLGYSTGCICACCKKRYGFKTYRGYKWIYYEEGN